MNLEILKKNIVIVPVIIAILSGTVASVRYVLNLTNTINASKQELVDLKRDLNVERDRINKAQGDISNINGRNPIFRLNI